MSVYLFLSRAVLGFVLGLMYQRSKNIWVNIGAHFLNNALALIQLFWASRHTAVTGIDKQDTFVPLWLALLAAAAIYGLFRLFEKVSQKNRFLISFEEQNLFEKSNPVHSIAQH
jgi:ABC-type antimicrobial peptide transport system permease subunit